MEPSAFALPLYPHLPYPLDRDLWTGPVIAPFSLVALDPSHVCLVCFPSFFLPSPAQPSPPHQRQHASCPGRDSPHPSLRQQHPHLCLSPDLLPPPPPYPLQWTPSSPLAFLTLPCPLALALCLGQFGFPLLTFLPPLNTPQWVVVERVRTIALGGQGGFFLPPPVTDLPLPWRNHLPA